MSEPLIDHRVLSAGIAKGHVAGRVCENPCKQIEHSIQRYLFDNQTDN